MGKNHNEIRQRQQEMFWHAPPVDSIWKHYKGGTYKVTGIVMEEATLELKVCYTNTVHPLIYSWSRPLNEWGELIEWEGKVMRRFTEVTAMGEE